MNVFEFTKKILAQTDKGMAILDCQGNIQYANAGFSLAAGGPKALEALAGIGLISPDGREIQEILAGLGPGESWQGGLVCRPGGEGENRLNASIVRIASGDEGIDFLLSLVPPDKPGRQSSPNTVDGLTGLPGKAIFLDRAAQSVRFSRREKSFTIMFLIRLDRFSLMTDGLGREHGDRILRAAARRLQSAFRESDTIARVDRHTFGLLLKMARESHASLVADKVLKLITRPIGIDGQKMVVTASIGIVSCHDAEKSGEQIMAGAEAAVHHASEQGGNQYHFFSSDLNKRARKRIDMENHLRTAVEAGEFVLHYQPKVDIASNRIVGAEALIRWEHPVQGMISPLNFIPVAEETGLIIDIGRWVLGEACGQILRWQQQGVRPVPVAVNVSPRQFEFPGFYGDVSSALAASGLDPRLLELEITESMLMADVEQVIDKLRRLNGVGLNLAIDDFGTGYSNLSYLVRFPVSTLKIDRTFVKDLETDESMAGLTHSIIAMSKNLNLRIVAEGAENARHVKFLKKHGCKVVQGHYYSRPLPAREFGRLLRAGKISPGLGEG